MVRRNLGLPHRLISKNFNCVIWVKKRNAARKTGSDVEKDLEWAEKELDKMHRGIIKFDDLPKKAIDSSSGSAASKMLYGNLKNPNFYI